MYDSQHAAFDHFWEAPDVPLTPDQIAELLARSTSLLMANLYYPDGNGGPEQVIEELGFLCGTLQAIGDHYTSLEFRELNSHHFAVAHAFQHLRENIADCP